MKRIAIVGAGPAGLGAAWKLRERAAEVVVFEKSRGFGGRAASRSAHGARIDPGANYFKTTTPEVERLVRELLPTEDLIDITPDIWVFDGEGRLAPGDPEQNRDPKWNYRGGINTLGKLLAEASGVEVRREAEVGRLDEAGGNWRLCGKDGRDLGSFEAVLLTPPAPQCATLLRTGNACRIDEVAAFLEFLGRSEFHRQFCFALGYDLIPPRPGDFYAAINADRRHDVAWFSFENDKPGRVPGGNTVVMAQMAPAWSAARFETPPEDLIPGVVAAVEALLGWQGIRPGWVDSQRWKFAHPAHRLDPARISELEGRGLFFAGDAWVGKGRIGEALQTGLDAGDRLKSRF